MNTIKAGLCFLILLFTGCNSRTTNTESNAGYSEAEAKAFGTQFYTLLKNKEYQNTYSLYGELFYKKSDTANLQQVYDSTTKLLGEILDFNMDNCAIESGDSPEKYTQYRMLYKVRRSKFDTEESICLLKKNGQTKIVYYFVESEAYRIAENSKRIEQAPPIIR